MTMMLLHFDWFVMGKCRRAKSFVYRISGELAYANRSSGMAATATALKSIGRPKRSSRRPPSQERALLPSTTTIHLHIYYFSLSTSQASTSGLKCPVASCSSPSFPRLSLISMALEQIAQTSASAPSLMQLKFLVADFYSFSSCCQPVLHSRSLLSDFRGHHH